MEESGLQQSPHTMGLNPRFRDSLTTGRYSDSLRTKMNGVRRLKVFEKI